MSAVPQVVIGCAPADEIAVRALAQRLSAETLEPLFAPDVQRDQRDPARFLRDAVRRAGSVIIAFSRRSWDADGNLVAPLANFLDLVLLTPGIPRLVALKLSACTLPPGLEHADLVELFAYSGYTRLRDLLVAAAPRERAVARAEPPPPAPRTPALALRGRYALPTLERQGHVRRIGRGLARSVRLITSQRALLISGGGATLLDLRDNAPVWTIDCPASCGALSAQERLLALAGNEQIVIWDLQNGQVQTTLSGSIGRISGLAFAPDERTLASVGHDGALRIWRVGDVPPRPVALLATVAAHPDQALSVAFSPNGTLIATGGADRTVRIWRLLDRALVQTLTGAGGAVEALAFSPDGALLAAGSRGRTVRLWATQTWQERAVLSGHTGAIEAVAFSADGTHLASAATDQTVRLWRVPEYTPAQVLHGHAGPVRGVGFSPDSALIAGVGEDDRLYTWQCSDGAAVHGVRPLSGPITALAFSADGERLGQGSADGAVTIYGIGGEAPPQTRYNDHQGAITGIAFSRDQRVITSAADRSVRACRFADGRSAILLQTHGTFQVAAVAPDGRLIVTSDGGTTVQLWQLSAADAPPAGTFWRALRGVRSRLRLVAFDAPALQIAVVGEDGSVRIWRTADLSGRDADPAIALDGDGSRVQAVAFSAEGAQIALAGPSGQIQIWRIDAAPALVKRIESAPQPTSLAFAPDGRAIAVGSAAGGVQIWRLNDHEQRRRRPAGPAATLHAHAGAVAHLTYHPSGELLASGSSDGVVRIWQI